MSPRKSHPYLVLFALWLMVFSASSQVMIMSPMLPRIGEELQIGEALQGLLITSYAVFLSIFALITGPISDKFGRRIVLLVGCGSMAIALLMHAAADSFVSLLAMRAVAGAAGGMLSGAAVAYVGDYFPYSRRGWANGWVMSGLAFGQIAGIPLGIVLAGRFGFKAAFLMFGATMLVATALVWMFVPQPDVDRDSGQLTIRRVLRNYRDLLRRREIAAVTVVYFLMFFSIGMFVIYLPTWLESSLSVSGQKIALLFAFGGVAHVISGPLAGRLSDSIGRKPLIVTSCAGFAVIMLATTYVISEMWIAYVLFALAMVMVSMRISPLQSLMTALVKENRRGALMSLSIAIGQVGIGIGSAAAGITYTEYGYSSNTLAGAAAMVVVAAIVYYFLPEPKEDFGSASA